MRILDIILEGSDNVVIIGDSIAVGIGGGEPYAKGGISTNGVLRRVNAFVASGKAKGATVILSSGASNSSPIELEGGIKKSGNGGLGPVSQQLKALKEAGAAVALVGTGSEKSKMFPGTSFTGGKKYAVDLTGVNQQLESMANATGATFLGPLEQYDPAMHSGKGDGIHPFGGYLKLKQAGMSAGGNIKPKEENKQDPSPKGTTSAFVVPVPGGRRGAAVADVQKALVALGYDIGPHGVDGVRGPYTSAAVKKLQAQLGVAVDGDPGPETVAALNKLLISKPELTAKLSNSKETDVKGPDYSAGAGQYAGLANDENAQKAQSASEKFLGRKIESDEWNYLVRGIYAEATSNQKEIAYVAAVMLNRTRSGKWGRSIISVLRAPNQFQSVTGTRADGHSASRNFTQGPGAGSLGNIYKALIDILPHAPTDILRFTAANRKAYGAGTNVGYLDQLIAQGGQQIGGTVFA